MKAQGVDVSRLTINSVDESQGRDFDIGVLDLTVYERLVFMEGPFGLFVALSRFKHGLVVLGSKHQITHAKGRDQYVSVFLSQSPKTVTYHFDVPTDASLLSGLNWFAPSFLAGQQPLILLPLTIPCDTAVKIGQGKISATASGVAGTTVRHKKFRDIDTAATSSEWVATPAAAANSG